jgi:tetratricopeptide (TPR) repeat protein
MYHALGQAERAIQDYDQAIRIDPRFAIAYRNRGLSYAGLGQFALAIQDYDQAIGIDSSYTLAYLNRGAAYSALGERDRAAQDYGQAVRLDPNNADGYNGRCYAFAVIGRAADGLADCDRSLQLRPNDANTLDSRAYAYLRLGRLNESLRDYDAAIAAGNSAIARFGRAIVRAGLGDRAGATADLVEARRLNATIDAYAARVSLTAPTFIPAPGETPPVAPGPAATPPVASGPVATPPASSGPVVTPPVSSGPAATPPAVDRDALFWQSIQASTNLGDFEAYLRQFPSGTFAELARNRIAALRAPAAPPLAADDLAIVPPQLGWVRGAQGQPVLVIQGVIRNAAAAARPVPPLRVIMRAGEVEIHSWTFTAAAPEVGARAEVPYRTEIADPPQASTLVVVFGPAR